MQWYRNLQMMFKIVLPVGIMLVIALGALTWQIQQKCAEAIEAVAKRELANLAGEKGNEIGRLFDKPINEAHSLASAVEKTLEKKQPLSREIFISMLEGILDGNPSFLGVGSVWLPGAFDERDEEYRNSLGSDSVGRFIPYIASGTPLAPLEDFEQAEYYTIPKTLNRSVLAKPCHYLIGGKQTMMTTASAVVQKNGRFKGVILIDLSLETIAEAVKNLRIYETGWASLLTDDGTIIAHKNQNLVSTNFFDANQVQDKESLHAAMAQGIAYMELYDNGEEVNFHYYYPISFSLTGQSWYFVVSAPENEVLADVAAIQMVTIAISVLALLLAMGVIFLVVGAAVKPLAALASTAKEIAKGNLQIQIRDENMGGEIRELSTSFKEMITSLLQHISQAETMSADAKIQAEKAKLATVEAEKAKLAAESARRDGMLAAADELETVVEILTHASHDLGDRIAQSEEGSAAQASSVASIATAMNEMNSTVLEVAKNASAAADVSVQAREKAEVGAKVVHEAIQGIQNVQEVSLTLREDMGKLEEQAQSISTIMNVISDIADQTNLLALNAAIEAARAGEAGRGFAVVADEVRKLAEKTMDSTSEVGNAIRSIQQSVQLSMGQVDQAVDLISKATEQSSRSGAALSEIVTMIDTNADQVRAIATASEEQSATSDEINRSVTEVNSIAANTAEAMHSAAQAVADLTTQARTLSKLIEEMKGNS